MSDAVRCVAAVNNRLGEGVMWSAEDQAVYWVDIVPPSHLYRLVPSTGQVERWPMPEMVSALARHREGGFLVGSHRGVHRLHPEQGRFERIAHPEAANPLNRSNDGGPDARGRFWIGTMQNNIAPDGSDMEVVSDAGTLWRIDPDGSATAMVTGIRIPNSIAFSPDHRTLYLADSPKQVIWAYPFDLEAGTLGTREVFSDRTDLGFPDGATVDAEGHLWSARWDGGCVARFAPDGTLDRTVAIPAERVTCCAFGGPTLETLYVTTSRANLDEDALARQPEAGGLFAVEPGIRGLARPMVG